MEKPRDSARRLLGVNAVEALLLYYRLVVVDVVALRVAEGAVVVAARAPAVDGERYGEHHRQHYEYYYQRCHLPNYKSLKIRD